jgi:hypothetical protein
MQVTFYDKLLVSTLAPLVVVALLLCTYTVVCRRDKLQQAVAVTAQSASELSSKRAERLARVQSRHQLVFLVMTFLIYSTVSTTVFQTFACDSTAGLGGSYLRADYSISCGTRAHTLYRVYAAFMVALYPLGIPAVYAYLLWSHKELLNATAASTGSSSGSFSSTLRRRNEHISLNTSQFLWQAYRPGMYYWELVECARRLLLTGAIVFIYPNTATQAAVACVLSVLSLGVVLRFRPHCDTVSEHLYVTGSAIIFLSIFLALLIKANVNEADTRSQGIYSAVLVVMNIALLAVAVLQIALAGRRSVLACGEIKNFTTSVFTSKSKSIRSSKTDDVNDDGAPKI